MQSNVTTANEYYYKYVNEHIIIMNKYKVTTLSILAQKRQINPHSRNVSRVNFLLKTELLTLILPSDADIIWTFIIISDFGVGNFVFFFILSRIIIMIYVCNILFVRHLFLLLVFLHFSISFPNLLKKVTYCGQHSETLIPDNYDRAFLCFLYP